MVRVPPKRSNSCSCSARRSLGCNSSGMSPISSRNSVPLLANSNRPAFCMMAPVKAPFSWPNSSLSSSPVGMAAQIVKGARDQLLSGSGFPQNQNRSVGGRHRFHLSEDVAELRAVADDLTEIPVGADFILQIQFFFG